MARNPRHATQPASTPKLTLRDTQDKLSLFFQAATLGSIAWGTLIFALGSAFLGEQKYPSQEVIALFAQGARDLLPEAEERNIFLASIAVFPAIVLGATYLTLQLNAKDLGLAVKRHLTTLLAVILTGAAFWTVLEGRLGYLISGWQSLDSFRVFSLTVAFALMLYLFIRALPFNTENRVWKVSTYALMSGVAALTIFGIRTYGIGSITPETPFSFHLEAVMYSVTQSVAGRTPLADFPSLYGFFGELLTPWFNLIGLSIAKFTLTMNTLQWLSASMMLWFFRRQIRNHALFVLSAFGFLWMTCNWYMVMVSPDSYFQYWPVRFLFPSATVLAMDSFLNRPTRRGMLAISALSGLSLIWNLETGVAITGSWIALNLFRELSQPGALQNWKPVLRNLGLVLAGVLAPLVLFEAWLCLHSGTFVNPAAAAHYQKMFYLAGYYMLPMPREYHPWMVVAFVYLIGLTLSALKFMGRVKDPQIDRIFFLTILGVGLFPYYQGRSHDFVMTAAAWPSYVLIFMYLSGLVDRAHRIFRESPEAMVATFWPLAPGMAMILAFATLGAYKTFEMYPRFEFQAKKHWSIFSNPPATPLMGNIQYVRNTIQGAKQAAILSSFQATYYAETGLQNPLKGAGLGESYLMADFMTIRDQLASNPPAHLYVGAPFLPGAPGSLYEPILGPSKHLYKAESISPTSDFIHFVRADSTATTRTLSSEESKR